MKTAAWERQTARLKFRLGELPLFAATFRALVYNPRVPATPPGDAHDGLPELPSGVDAAVICSCAIQMPLPRLGACGRLLRYVPRQYHRYHIDLASGTFDDYLRRYSSKTRATLIRKVRKLAEANGGSLDWREYRTPDELAEFLPVARVVSAKSYQERLLASGLPATATYTETLSALAASDAVRGYLLFLKGAPIAYVQCSAVGDVLLYMHVGYDPAYARWSPGTVLQYAIVQRLFADQRFRVFDFTEGEGDHKAFFSTGSTLCADIYYFRRSVRNVSLVYLHALLSHASRRAAAGLDKIGLKHAVKQAVRRI